VARDRDQSAFWRPAPVMAANAKRDEWLIGANAELSHNWRLGDNKGGVQSRP